MTHFTRYVFYVIVENLEFITNLNIEVSFTCIPLNIGLKTRIFSKRRTTRSMQNSFSKSRWI